MKPITENDQEWFLAAFKREGFNIEEIEELSRITDEQLIVLDSRLHFSRNSLAKAKFEINARTSGP